MKKNMNGKTRTKFMYKGRYVYLDKLSIQALRKCLLTSLKKKKNTISTHQMHDRKMGRIYVHKKSPKTTIPSQLLLSHSSHPYYASISSVHNQKKNGYPP